MTLEKSQSRLVILVSNDFVERGSLNAYGKKIDDRLLGVTRLHVFRGGEKALREVAESTELSNLLENSPDVKVRIVAHLSVCFGNRFKNDWKTLQTRLRDEETNARLWTKHEDVEVWGFKHADSSTVYAVLTEIVQELSIKPHDPETAASLGAKLDRAFHDATVKEAYEELSLIRHDVVRPFMADQLNLQIDPSSVNTEQLLKKRDVAVEKMQGKFPCLASLEHADGAKKQELGTSKNAIIDVLHRMPVLHGTPQKDLESFNQWLKELESGFDAMWGLLRSEGNAKA